MGRKGKSEEGKNLGGGYDDDGGGLVVVEWVGLGYVVCLVDVFFFFRWCCGENEFISDGFEVGYLVIRMLFFSELYLFVLVV